MGVLVLTSNAAQPARKPFLQIKIDGKISKSGDLIIVKPGQKLAVEVELEGGRRDFCNFPDTYSDIAGTAQIVSRSNNGLSYIIDGVKAEWKLTGEEFQFSSEDFIKIKSAPNQNSAELTVSNARFSQSFVKITAKAKWQFNQEGKSNNEENQAEATIYFKLEGASDVWFISQNINASGIKDENIREKLVDVQSACDSIEKNFHHLNFGAVQGAIRNLQSKVNTLKSTIDGVKENNSAYQTKISFIGLPSDDPYSDIEVFNTIKSNWSAGEALVNDLKTQMQKLDGEATNENKKTLLGLIGQYSAWLAKIPESNFRNLADYIPEINTENIRTPENLGTVASANSISDYPKTLSDFAAFIDRRIEQVASENQLINSIHSRLQAVRLFDGMLRSYFSSITWAEWKSTRGF
jgi:hypothetical protein